MYYFHVVKKNQIHRTKSNNLLSFQASHYSKHLFKLFVFSCAGITFFLQIIDHYFLIYQILDNLLTSNQNRQGCQSFLLLNSYTTIFSSSALPFYNFNQYTYTPISYFSKYRHLSWYQDFYPSLHLFSLHLLLSELYHQS